MLINSMINMYTVSDSALFSQVLQTNVYLLTPCQITYKSIYVQLSPFSIVVNGVMYQFPNSTVIPMSTDNLQNPLVPTIPDGVYILELLIINTSTSYQPSLVEAQLNWPQGIYLLYAPIATQDQRAVALAQVTVQDSLIQNVVPLPIPLLDNLLAQKCNNESIASLLANTVTIATSGDAAGSATFNGSPSITIPLTLANSGVAAGTYGSSTNIPQITIDGKGRITYATNVAVSIPSGSINVTGDDLTMSGSTGTNITNATLVPTGVNAGTYGNASNIPQITIDGKGRITSASNVAISIPSSSINVTGTDITMSGTTGTAITNATLTNTGVKAGTYGSATQIPVITFDSKGRATNITLANVATNSISNSISVTGSDLTMSGTTGSAITNATLTNTGVTPGTYNNSNTQITPFTVDSKGRITGVSSSITITPNWSSITNKPTTLAGYGITDGAPINNPTFTGTVTTPNLNITNTLITSNGNIGIGTTSPNFKLDVIGIISSGYNVGNGEIRSYQSTDGVSYVSLKTDATLHKSGIYRNAAGDFPFYYNTSTGDTVLNVVWNGASIVFQVSNTEKMRVANNGNLGVGTTSPGERLDVSGNIQLSGALKCNLITTLTGTTAGSVQWSQYMQGQFKAFAAQFLSYENNSTTNQTITFPTPFVNTPVIVTNTTGLTITVTTTTLTIGAPNNTTTYSGIVEVKGF